MTKSVLPWLFLIVLGAPAMAGAPGLLAADEDDPVDRISCELMHERCPDENKEHWTGSHPSGAGAVAKGTAVHPDGDIVYSSGWTGEESQDYTVVAHDASTGETLWVSKYDGPDSDRDEVTAMAVSPDGSRVYATGFSRSEGWMGFATLAYDARTGALDWEARWDGPGDDVANAIAVSADSSMVFVTGQSETENGEAGVGAYDVFTVAYHAQTGAESWTSRYAGPDDGIDLGSSVAVHNGLDRVFVTGTEVTGSGFQWVTLAYDAATGSQVWARGFVPGSGINQGQQVVVDEPNDRVFVAGIPDAATVAYDAVTGQTLWEAPAPIPGSGYGLRVVLAPQGDQVYVAGGAHSPGSVNLDYLAIAFDAEDGTVTWSTTYDGPGGDWDLARGLAVSPDGDQVFLTGESTNLLGNWDYATLALDAYTGERQWLTRYGSPEKNDAAFDLAVSPDGTRLYVTGESVQRAHADITGPTVHPDRWAITTLAYETDP